MRKEVVVRLAVVAVWVFAASDALAVYTPNPAGRWAANRFFIAGDLQYNDEKDVQTDDGGIEGKIEDEVGFFVRPSYSFMENGTIYGRIGVQEADGTDSEFAIGFGAQAAWALPAADDWAIGVSFDYLYWDLDNIDYHEIQFAPAVSYRIPQVPEITPYFGLMADFIVDDLEEDDPVGIMFGSNFDIGEHIRFDTQVRLISETGFLLSAGFLF